MQRNGIINVDTAQCIINTEGGGYYDTTAGCWNLDVAGSRKVYHYQEKISKSRYNLGRAIHSLTVVMFFFLSSLL